LPAFIDYRKYPMLVNIRRYVERRWAHGITLVDVLGMLESTVMKRAEERVMDAINSEAISDPPPDVNVDAEVLAYHVSLVIVSAICDRWLANSYAVKEAKRIYQHLIREDDRVVEAIGKYLGLRIEYNPDKAATIPYMYAKGQVLYLFLPYRIHFIDYVKYTKRLSGDPKWKLTNQFIKKGYVYLDRRRIARILEEVFAEKILETIKPLDEVPEPIKDIVDHIVKALEEKRGSIFKEVVEKTTSISRTGPSIKEIAEELKGIIDLESFPPCIKNLYDRALRGDHLSHHERFALATFLLNIGMDIDSVVNVFRNSPDFNEKIARYQVEHLAGLRGSRKRYLPYNCDTMRTIGICIEACNVKNPLVYYWRQIRSKYRRIRKKENKKREEDKEAS